MPFRSALIALVWLIAACGLALEYEITPWPEADALFHRDPQWLGGDDAGSLDLGEGRVAWFFGDSFVAPTTPGNRRGSAMIRNSVGIQTGYNPTTAEFKAFWLTAENRPTAYFPNQGEDFLWPGGSRLVEGKLLIFFMHARKAETKLKFQSTGWSAVLIENPRDSPDKWKVKKLESPSNPWLVLVGSSSVLLEGEHVIAFSVADVEHEAYLVRWRATDAAAGDLSRPEWWAGDQRGWVLQTELANLPSPIFLYGQNEFTAHRVKDHYLQVQFRDFPLSPIGVRTAPQLTGPWSPLADLFTPEEARNKNSRLMCYAAKAHPEQQAAGLALTYCPNTFEWTELLDNQRLYYPRFLQLQQTRGTN